MNGRTVPLWRDPILPSECVYPPIDFLPDVNRDRDHPDQPELAQAQLAHAPVWKLPAELGPNGIHASDDIEPQDVAQRIISDCSVCASIVVCLAHHKRFSSEASFLGLLNP